MSEQILGGLMLAALPIILGMRLLYLLWLAGELLNFLRGFSVFAALVGYVILAVWLLA